MIMCAAFIPVTHFLHYLIDYERLISKVVGNPWDKFFISQVTMTPTLITFFVVLVATFVMYIEHRSEGLKLLFTLPVQKTSIYFGKLIAASTIVFATYLLFLCFVVAFGYILGYFYPKYGFSNHSPDVVLMAKVLFSSYTTTLGVLAVQYWISFKTKNFIIPVGIGIVGIILGLILFRSPRFSPFIPYSYNISNFMDLTFSAPDSLAWVNRYSLFSIVTFFVFSVLGCINVGRSNII